MSPFYAAAVATDNASASALAEITAWKRHLPGMESLLDLLITFVGTRRVR